MSRIFKCAVTLLWMTSSLWAQGLQLQMLQNFPSPFLSHWMSDPSIAVLTITNTSPDKGIYFLEFALTDNNGNEVVTGFTEKITVNAGGVYTLRNTDLFSLSGSGDYNTDIATKVIRTNTLPEGMYTIDVKLVDGKEIVRDTRMLSFYIVGIGSPQLVSPINGDVVLGATPHFSWASPVEGIAAFQIKYRFVLFESYPGADPHRVIQKRQPLYTTDLINSTGLTWSSALPRFERGGSYFWYVEAYNANAGSMFGESLGGKSKFRSEIYTFSYLEPAGEITDALKELKELAIVEGKAFLRNLDKLTITENVTSYKINGFAPLVTYIGFDSLVTNVHITNLTFDKGFNGVPRFTAGDLFAELPKNLKTPSILERWPVKLKEVTFAPLRGLELTAALDLPDLSGLQSRLDGAIGITSGGLKGALRMRAKEGKPLFSIVSAPGSVTLDEVSFNCADMHGAVGVTVNVVNARDAIKIKSGLLTREGITINEQLEDTVSISLLDSSVTLQANSGTISLYLNPWEKKVDWQIDAEGAVDLAVAGLSVQSSLSFGFSSKNGFELYSTGLKKDFNVALSDEFSLALSNLTIESISFKDKVFDFSFETDLGFSIASFDKKIPSIEGLKISKKGITFEEKSWSLDRFSFSSEEFSLRLDSLKSRAFTFDIFHPGKTDFPLSFSGALKINNLSSVGDIRFSDRMRNLEIPFRELSLSDGLAISIEPQTYASDFPYIDFGNNGTKFLVKQISGAVAIVSDTVHQAQNSAAVLAGELESQGNSFENSGLKLAGDLQLPDEISSAKEVAAQFSLGAGGRLSGDFKVDMISGRMGMISYALKKGVVAADISRSNQSLVVSGSAELSIDNDRDGKMKSKGSLAVDLISGKVLDADIEVTNFQLPLPPKDPLFTFDIDKAKITKDAFSISSKQMFRAGNEKFEVYFDSVKIDWKDFAIAAGAISFLDSFSLGLDYSNGMRWFTDQAASVQEAAENQVKIRIPSNVSLDSSGLTLSDLSFGVPLSIGGATLTTTARITHGTTINYKPVGIVRGEAVFSLNENDVAKIDADGFRLLGGIIAQLPDTIALGSVARIYTRDAQGGAVCRFKSTDDGLHISTIDGKTVRCDFPALKIGDSIPSVQLQFNAVFDPFSMSLIDGSVAIPKIGVDLSSVGVPFVIDSGHFGVVDGIRQFSFSALPSLLGKVLPQQYAVPLTITEDGHIRGDLQLKSPWSYTMGTTESGELIRFTVAQAEGHISCALKSLFFKGSANGSIELKNGEWKKLVDLDLEMSTAKGLTLNTARVHDDIVKNLKLPLGSIELALGDVQIDRFSWTPRDGFDWALSLAGGISLPSYNIALPHFEDIGLTVNGLELPNLSMASFPSTLTFDAGAFRFQPTGLEIPSMEISLWERPDFTKLKDIKFSFDITPVGAQLPDALKLLQFSVSNAGFVDGHFVGNINPKKMMAGMIPEISFADKIGFKLDSLAGILDTFSVDGLNKQAMRLDLAGLVDLQNILPGVPKTELVLSVDLTGNVTGTWTMNRKVALPLPLCTLAVHNSSFSFSFGKKNQLLAGGRWGVVADGIGDAQGDMTIDILTGKVVSGGVKVNRTLEIALPSSAEKFLNVKLNGLSIDVDGIGFNGSQSITIGGEQFGISCDSVLFDLFSGRMKNGTVTFNQPFAINGEFTSSLNTWKTAAQADAAELIRDGFSMMLPAGMKLKNGALQVEDSAAALIRYADSLYSDLKADFGSFKFDIYNRVIESGSVALKTGLDTLVHMSAEGIVVSLNTALPKTIPLPSVDIAYLDLEKTSLSVSKIGDTLSIRGNGAKIMIPALGRGDSIPSITLDSLDVGFSITQPGKLLRGSLKADAPSGDALLDLSGLGIPFDLQGLAYAKQQSGVGDLVCELTPQLPDEFKDVLNIKNIRLTSNGLSGSFRRDSLRVAIHDDYCRLDIDSVKGAFEGSVDGIDGTFSVSGAVGSKLFGDENKLAFTLGYSDNAWIFNVDESQFVDGFSLYKAKLKRAALNNATGTISDAADQYTPITLGVDADGFFAAINGELTFPEFFGDRFGLVMDNVKISKSGLVFNDIEDNTERSIELYGLTFTLNEFALRNTGIPSIRLAGSATILEENISVDSLVVSLNGTVNGAVSLPEGGIALADSALNVTKLGIDSSMLKIDMNLTIPEPLASVQKDFSFAFKPDGSVLGETKIPVFDEGDDLGAEFWEGRIDLTYGALTIDPSELKNSRIELCAKLSYDGALLAEIGKMEGTAVHPGLTVGFDGAVTWNNVTTPISLGAIKVDMGPLLLKIEDIGAAVSEVGKFGLNMNATVLFDIDGDITSSIKANGMKFTPSGLEDALYTYISGGDLTVDNLFTFTVKDFEVGDFDYSHGDTSISVTSGFLADSAYLTIGTDLLKGGVERLVLYEVNGKTNFALVNAQLSAMNLFSATASLRYMSDNRGYSYAAAGNVDIAGLCNAGLGGTFARRNGKLSAGLLVNTTIPGGIPIAPGVNISGMTGGFFINPSQEDIRIAQGAAGFAGNGKSSADSLMNSSDLSTFSLMLGGDVQVIRKQVAAGKALVTISDQWLQIQGAVALLDQGDAVGGYMDLKIAYESGLSVAGQIGVVMSIPGVHGTGRVDFASIKGTENSPGVWYIKGSANGYIISRKFMEADFDFFIGEPGFTFGGNAHAGLKFWLIDCGVDVGGRVWNLWESEDSPWELGGYFGYKVKVSVLFGAVSASVGIDAVAKVNGDGLCQAKGMGYGKACVSYFIGKKCWSEYVWVIAQNREDYFSGGFGKKAEIVAELDRAKNMNATMQAAMDSAIAAIETAKYAAAGFSDSSIDIAALNFANQMDNSGMLHRWMENEKRWVTRGHSRLNDIRLYKEALQVKMPGHLYYASSDFPNPRNFLSLFNSDIESMQENLNKFNLIGFESNISSDGLQIESSVPVDNITIADTSAAAYEASLQAISGKKDDYEQLAGNVATDIETSLEEDEQIYQDILRAFNNIENYDNTIKMANIYAQKLRNLALPFSNRYGLLQSKNLDKMHTLMRQLNLGARRANEKEYMGGQVSLADMVAGGMRVQSQEETLNNLCSLVVSRSKYIDSLFPENTSDLQAVLNQIKDTVMIRPNAEKIGKQLWIDVPRIGRQKIADGFADSVLLSSESAHRNIALVREIHRLFSQIVETMYEVRLQYAETVLNLCDEFLYANTITTSTDVVTRRKTKKSARDIMNSGTIEQDRVGKVTEIRGKRARLAKTFNTIPRIENINYALENSNDKKASINLNISASNTECLMISVDDGSLKGDADNQFRFVSINGEGSTFDYFLPVTKLEEENRNLAILVKAYGNGGVVVKQRLDIPLKLKSSVIATSQEETNTAGSSVVEACDLRDITPPKLTGMSVRRHQFITDAIYDVSVSATEYESDIKSYEYMVTTHNLSDTLKTENTGRLSNFNINNVSLQHNNRYKIFYRAENTSEVWSSWAEGAQVQVDTTKPSAPMFDKAITSGSIYTNKSSEYDCGEAMVIDGFYYSLPSVGVSHFDENLPVPKYSSEAICVPCQGNQPSVVVHVKDGSHYSNLIDAESGVGQYFFKYTRTPDDPDSLQGWRLTGVSSYDNARGVVIISGGDLSWTDSVYVHIRAVNRAGRVGPGLVTGPLDPVDYTPPTQPQCKIPLAVNNCGPLRIPLTRESEDPHTQIKLYQYKIFNPQAYGVVYQDWTVADVVTGYETQDNSPLPRLMANYLLSTGSGTNVNLNDAGDGTGRKGVSSGRKRGSSLVIEEKSGKNAERIKLLLIPSLPFPTGTFDRLPLRIQVRTMNGDSLFSNMYTHDFCFDNVSPSAQSQVSSSNGYEINVKNDQHQYFAAVRRVSDKVILGYTSNQREAIKIKDSYTGSILPEGGRSTGVDGSLSQDAPSYELIVFTRDEALNVSAPWKFSFSDRDLTAWKEEWEQMNGYFTGYVHLDEEVISFDQNPINSGLNSLLGDRPGIGVGGPGTLGNGPAVNQGMISGGQR